MNRILAAFLATILLATSISAQAASYGGYARNWWVEANGDITFYLWNIDNTASVAGMCGANVYRLRTTNANFDEAYASFLLAAKNSYKVWMEVTTCAGTVNLIDMAKICTTTAVDC
ncbi:MAG: hypothetical protein ACEQSB_04985 [Undibacterium sp.]